MGKTKNFIRISFLWGISLSLGIYVMRQTPRYNFSILVLEYILFFISGMMIPAGRKDRWLAALFVILPYAVINYLFIKPAIDAPDAQRWFGFMGGITVVGYFITVAGHWIRSKNKSEKMLWYWIIVFVILIISLLSGIVNWKFQLFITGISYLVAGTYIQLKLNDRKLFFGGLAFLPYFMVFAIPVIFLNPVLTLISMTALASLLFGLYVPLQLKTIAKYSVIQYASWFILLIAFGYIVLPNLLFSKNTMIYTGEEINAAFTTPAGDTLRLDSLNGKVVVLDFWNSSCSVCIEKFPEFNKLYSYYQDHPDISVFSVFIPVGNENPKKADEILTERGFSFPILIAAEDYDTVSRRFNFQGVPALVILDKHGRIRYKSTMSWSRYIFMNPPRKVIRTLLRESG